ncbi:STAS domain-containing protein [Gaiella sp.]|jgi:anti-sigma B factor antagonist|uniref:STAS domain-containing protein n=1 Tax=Gaiella sp. TaxID=2663207 RepID=UPI002E363326|nr:STAS domain-containing protein [Gaiella sp.]HEX5584209.1 STAS domain-containing protein [Gaiella sp.]
MESIDFEVVTEETSTGLRVVVRGDLDLATVDALRSTLEDAHAASKDVAVDLHACTFLDSSALKAIADAGRRAGEAGVGFVVMKPSPQAARVLEISGLNEIVTIATDDYP